MEFRFSSKWALQVLLLAILLTCLAECSPLKHEDDSDSIPQPQLSRKGDQKLPSDDFWLGLPKKTTPSNGTPSPPLRPPNKKLQRLIDLIVLVRRYKPALLRYLRTLKRNVVVLRFLKNLGRRLGIEPRLWKLIVKDILTDLRPSTRSTKATWEVTETTTPDLMRPPPKMYRKVADIICRTTKTCH